MVTKLPASVQDGPVGTYQAVPAPAGGFQLEITIRHEGSAPLVDFYQMTAVGQESALLHPDEGPGAFRPCPSSEAPGWTCLGEGILPGDSAGPFIAWCAHPPAIFTMRWCAEDPEVGGPFEIAALD